MAICVLSRVLFSRSRRELICTAQYVSIYVWLNVCTLFILFWLTTCLYVWLKEWMCAHMLYIYKYMCTIYSVCIMYVCMYLCMYVCMNVCTMFYFSNGLLILWRRCEDEGERADVGVFRKDHRPSIRRSGAFQTSKMHMVGETYIYIHVYAYF